MLGDQFHVFHHPRVLGQGDTSKNLLRKRRVMRSSSREHSLGAAR